VPASGARPQCGVATATAEDAVPDVFARRRARASAERPMPCSQCRPT
jgi:hypothetical protein